MTEEKGQEFTRLMALEQAHGDTLMDVAPAAMGMVTAGMGLLLTGGVPTMTTSPTEEQMLEGSMWQRKCSAAVGIFSALFLYMLYGLMPLA